MRLRLIVLLAVLGWNLAGCALRPSYAQVGSGMGAIVGGVVGNVLFGSTLGTITGAATGALIGQQAGRANDYDPNP
ncbi:glycine zipper domain-containing protein [Comamonas composti]|uniref:glycine zipper domain-containing protein n=1 Tax=Comamonas composti TaxID=408558 RepID=UPI00041CE848|nr:glycine zipper domain-containing protein [Comamonas composti]